MKKAQTDAVEDEARQAKEQLAEMARTANEYDSLITKKEHEIAHLTEELDILSQERDGLQKQIIKLQSQNETLTTQMSEQRYENRQSRESQSRLQKEMDELRKLMEAKSSEETRRKEAERSKEKELLELRSQLSTLQHDLSESRKTAIEGQSRLKAELETALKDGASIQKEYQQLVDNERTTQSRLREIDAALTEADRAKRALESEYQTIKSKHIEVGDQLSEAAKAKEVKHI